MLLCESYKVQFYLDFGDTRHRLALDYTFSLSSFSDRSLVGH